MIQTNRSNVLLLACWCMVLAGTGRLWIAPLWAQEIRANYAMTEDPAIRVKPIVQKFEPAILPKWIEALKHSEADLQRLAAESIAQVVEAGFEPQVSARPHLLQVLKASTTHRTARFAAARALIKLDTREAAPALWDAAKQGDSELRGLVEPALATWDFVPARDAWRERLNAESIRRRELVLAIRCLATIPSGKEIAAEVKPLLLKLVHDERRSLDIRLATARTCGTLVTSGLEGDARKLASTSPSSSTSPSFSAASVARSCAVALLSKHDSEDARQLLTTLSGDEEPSVVAAALTRLFDIDPSLVLPLAEKAMNNPDSNVRRRGAMAYVTLPTPERCEKLARLLGDPHDGVRGYVRDSLFRLAATAELNASIRQSAIAVLDGDEWRGQEQSLLLLTKLDEKSIAPRAVELLESRRLEVAVTSAWSLRCLMVPATLTAILNKLNALTEARETGNMTLIVDPQAAHLCEALGVMRHTPGGPTLRKYVPKDFRYGDISRPAAIWALGKLHEGEPDVGLAKALLSRVEDVGSIPPETEQVRTASSIALGRMKADSTIAGLRFFITPEPSNTEVGWAIRWAIMHMTGETIPEPKAIIRGRSGWFLEPLDSTD